MEGSNCHLDIPLGNDTRLHYCEHSALAKWGPSISASILDPHVLSPPQKRTRHHQIATIRDGQYVRAAFPRLL
jgi:hypothetical protein